MIKKIATKLGLIKREVINKFTIVCDCCGKESTLEKKEPQYNHANDLVGGMGSVSAASATSLQQQINQYQAAQNQKSAMSMKPTKLHATMSGLQSGFMQQVGDGAEILPNGWYTITYSYNDRSPFGKTVCCEECLVKLLDKDKELTIEDYRKLQLNKLRK